MQYLRKALHPRSSRQKGILKQNCFYSHSLSPVFEAVLVCKSNNIECNCEQLAAIVWKKGTVHPVWENVVSSSNMTEKAIQWIDSSCPTKHIIWWRWKSSRFGVTAGQENILLPCGKHHINPGNYTLSSWYKVQLLFIVHLPYSLSKLWINCCSTLEEKEKSWEGKKGQIWARAPLQLPVDEPWTKL